MAKVKSNLLRIVCCLVLLLAIAPKLDAHADGEWKTCYSDVYIRSGPGTSYGIVGSIPAGADLKVYGLDGNGWYHVMYNGTEGYSYYELVDGPSTPEKNSVTSLYSVLYTTTDLNLRSGPDKSYSAIGVVPAGTKVETQASENGWFKVTYNNKTGWLSGKYLSDEAGDKPIVEDGYISGLGAGAVSGTETEAETKIEGDPESALWTTVDCYLRTGPAKTYSQICVIPAGTKLSVYGYENKWYYVYYGNADGYVSGKCLAASKGGQALVDANGNYTVSDPYGGAVSAGAASETGAGGSTGTDASQADAYVVVGAPDGLNVREAPSTTAGIVGVLPNGSKIAVFAKVGEWYEVFYKSNAYYCYGEYLQKVQ